ncbi:undecaprenyl-diphosphatase [Mesorhizobium sp. KR1-2]|uniref:undecaprenyl-diphosphatase n=1 Tax=Mesorhizobium sp. KR1-2 TaxID=3156609 RepID=UPI0032B3E698
MLKLDTDLFLLLNAGPTPNAAVAWLALFATKFIVLLIPLYLVGLWVSGRGRNRLTAIALLLALAIAIVMSSAVGLVVFRPRPFMIGLGNALVEHRPNSSFPSNHGLAFAVCAAVLFMLRRKGSAWTAAALGVLVGWSRIYIGVHYPLDMVGSIIVAVLAAMASLWIMARYGAVLLMTAERAQRLLLARFAKT